MVAVAFAENARWLLIMPSRLPYSKPMTALPWSSPKFAPSVVAIVYSCASENSVLSEMPPATSMPSKLRFSLRLTTPAIASAP